MTIKVTLGIDVLIAQDFAPLQGKRVGLFTNLCAVNQHFVPTYLILAHAPEVNLVALFAPEHGIFGAEPDGVLIKSSIDPTTQLPVHSLYGEQFRPTAEMLAEIDVMVCDIQDIGVRYYTFLWTLTHIVEVCGELGIPVLICDRPNPLGGNIVQGAPHDSRFSSIVGRYNVPIRHGLTIGEMASYINATHNAKPAHIDVVLCEGLMRSMDFEDCGLSWIPPSPNMAHFVTAQHYPGACFVEGTNLSEGRGTATPFEVVGAPFIDALTLAERLNTLNLAGVFFRQHTFRPTASKFAGELCYGVHVHPTDRKTFDPLRTWLTVLREIRQNYPQRFAWLPPYGQHPHIDLLAGSDQVRLQIDAGATVDEIMRGWDAYCADFIEKRKPYLRYD